MPYIEIPEIKEIRGKEAITALNRYIYELETQGDKTLTQKQTKALIKFAKALVSCLEAEHISPEQKGIEKTGLMAKLKRMLSSELTSGREYALPSRPPSTVSATAIRNKNNLSETTVPK